MRWSFGGPKPPTAATTASTSVAPLPAGWEERRDPTSGRSYYVDHNTKRTVWERPAAAPAPAPTDALSRDVAELQQVLPHVGAAAIRQELLRCNGNKQRAIDTLLASQPPGARAPLPVAHATAVAAKPVAMPMAVATAVPAGLSVAPHAHSWLSAPTLNAPPPAPSGRRKALLIGINYYGTAAELKGCINDVRAMRALLEAQGFSTAREAMLVLTDDARDPALLPTKANILAGCRWLTADARPGDVLFFHFSGHGAQQLDPDYAEEDGMDETIVPVDMQRAGQITDTQLHALLVEPLPSGARLTAVMDCCHSGTGLDLPFALRDGGRWALDDNPHFSLGDVVFFSGCEDHDYSADARPRYAAPGGAMTTAFVAAVREGRATSYPDFMRRLGAAMRQGGFSQRPQLCATQAFDTSRPFRFDDIHANTNPMIGRQFRVRHKHPRRPFGGGLNQLLMAGAAGYLALALAPGLVGAAAGGAGLLLDGAGAVLGGGGDALEGVARGLGSAFDFGGFGDFFSN